MTMKSAPDSYDGDRRPAPEEQRVQREEHQAADLQVAQVGAVADPDIEAGGEADQDRRSRCRRRGGRSPGSGRETARRGPPCSPRSTPWSGTNRRRSGRRGAAPRPFRPKSAFRQAQHGIRFSHLRCHVRASFIPGPAPAARSSSCATAKPVTALLMFLFSFLAMTSYNIIKPITRSEFISSLGADNLPVRAVRRGRADRLHHAGLHRRDARRCRGAGSSR